MCHRDGWGLYWGVQRDMFTVPNTMIVHTREAFALRRVSLIFDHESQLTWRRVRIRTTNKQTNLASDFVYIVIDTHIYITHVWSDRTGSAPEAPRAAAAVLDGGRSRVVAVGPRRALVGILLLLQAVEADRARVLGVVADSLTYDIMIESCMVYLKIENLVLRCIFRGATIVCAFFEPGGKPQPSTASERYGPQSPRSIKSGIQTQRKNALYYWI